MRSYVTTTASGSIAWSAQYLDVYGSLGVGGDDGTVSGVTPFDIEFGQVAA